MSEESGVIFELIDTEGDTIEDMRVDALQKEELLNALILVRDRKMDEMQSVNKLIRDIKRASDKKHPRPFWIREHELKNFYNFIAEAYIDSKKYNCPFNVGILSFADCARCGDYGSVVVIHED